MSKMKTKSVRDRGDRRHTHFRGEETITPPQKKQRDNSRRINQPFPGGNKFSRHDDKEAEAAEDEQLMHGGDSDDDVEERGGKRKRTDEYCEKKERRVQGWGKMGPRLQSELVDYRAMVVATVQQERDRSIAMRQRNIYDSWRMHDCEAVCDFSVKRTKWVLFFSTEFTGWLEIPLWYCETCNQSWYPSPLLFGCFPSSPIDACTWFAQPFLHIYSTLGPEYGTSATAFLDAVKRQHEEFGVSCKESSNIKACQLTEVRAMEARSFYLASKQRGSVGKNMRKRMRTKAAQVRGVLRQIVAMNGLGETTTASPFTDDEVNKLIYEGSTPWRESDRAGSNDYFGRTWHWLKEEEARCKEEIPKLHKSWVQYDRWINICLDNIKAELNDTEEALEEARELVDAREEDPTVFDYHFMGALGTGRGLLLRRMSLRLEGLKDEVKKGQATTLLVLPRIE